MSTVREAIVLPLLFLTVVLLAAVQPGARVTFSAAPVFCLVLAALLLTAVIRSGALAPERLMHGSRSVLANANGAVVIASVFAAASQVLATVIPRSGLPLFFVYVFLFVLLVNTLVTQPARIQLLRSVAVILGSALVLKFVVLDALAAPSGRLARVLFAVFDAATFGGVQQEAEPPAAGYLAFAAVGLFVAALALLPRRAELKSALPAHSRTPWPS
jgi:hypothetical protein